jgi:hypothetical protein
MEPIRLCFVEWGTTAIAVLIIIAAFGDLTCLGGSPPRPMALDLRQDHLAHRGQDLLVRPASFTDKMQ